jgi:hypothetical protein
MVPALAEVLEGLENNPYRRRFYVSLTKLTLRAKPACSQVVSIFSPGEGA